MPHFLLGAGAPGVVAPGVAAAAVVAPSSVALHVQREVVGPREGPLAQVALEGLLARVLPEVARQLVRPGELPRAALPRALVRFFAWNRMDERVELRTWATRRAWRGVAPRS